MGLTLTTTVGVTKPGVNSLRVTIPEGVVFFLGLEPRDKLEWRTEMINGEKVVTVHKVENAEEIAKNDVNSNPR